jgi:DNA-binding transcriptional LysR family regulator
MFRRLPSLSALRTFESAARLGSFKAAADELHVTATAVSHQIRALEQRLGQPLFHRSTRSITLTEPGRKIAAVLTQTFLALRDVVEEIAPKNAPLTISTTSSFATLWLVPRLVDFQARHPDCAVQLETTTRLTDLFGERRVDVAIRYGHGPYAGLDATPLFDERFGAYISPRLAPPADELPSELPLIETAWQQDVLEDVNWATWLSLAGLDPARFRTLRFNEEEHVLHAAIAGQGIALASSVLAAGFVDRGLLAPCRGEVRLAGARYVALCLPERRSAQKIDAFLGWVTSLTSIA